MQLTKHHALGNDFLIALVEQPDTVRIDGAFARRVCARKRGIGADGLIVGEIAPDDAHDLRMVLYNADGSRAEISGNGIRCLGHAEARRRATTALELRIATDAGTRVVQVRPTEDPLTVDASVTMGEVRGGPPVPAPPQSLPVARSASVDVGNPHWVVLVDDLNRVDVMHDGPAFESLVDGGINVEFVSCRDRHALDLIVWERGAGATDACGSGAVAAAHAAHRWGLTGDHVVVTMPGGSAQVVLDGDHATLIGPSVYIGRVELPDG